MLGQKFCHTKILKSTPFETSPLGTNAFTSTLISFTMSRLSTAQRPLNACFRQRPRVAILVIPRQLEFSCLR